MAVEFGSGRALIKSGMDLAASEWGTNMFVVQTGRARRTRKYSILMIFILFMTGALACMMGIFTLHWEVRPKKE
jgi:hypothetical protein